MAVLLFSAALLTLGAVPANASGTAADEGGDSTTKPRAAAEGHPGRYIQLQPIWIPVRYENGHKAQLPVTIRLFPNRDKMKVACYTSPKVHDAYVTRMLRDVFPVEEVYGLKKKADRLLAIAEKVSGEKVWEALEAYPNAVPIPDKDSEGLSKICN